MIKSLFSIYRQFSTHALTRHRPRRAFLNFVRWQIGARILRRSVVVPWVEDAKFLAAIGDTGITLNLYYGIGEFDEMMFLMHALRRSEIFVDIGANIGAYTIIASAVVRARSLSFEPVPQTAKRLQQQLVINTIQDLVTLQNKGVGEKRGTLSFSKNFDTTNKVVLDQSATDTIEVDVVSLDEELDRESDYFLKIDVEGFEYFVIKGAEQILSSGRVLAVIIEINGSAEAFGHSNESVHDYLCQFGFQPVSYDPLTRELTPISGYNARSGNTIYVRDVEAMMVRCKSAPLRVVHTANGITL